MQETHKRLSPDIAAFYGIAWSSARTSCLKILRRRGCSKEEAEDLFGSACEEVMETVDPIKRRFTKRQMVSYMKKRCESRWIDDKRRQSSLKFDPSSEVETYQDHAEDPARTAEVNETIQFLEEAELSLSPRERRIFQLRAEGLSPDEIRRLTPGLSYRTYRKLIERANKRVKAARSKIQSGQRCEELHSNVLREFIAGAGPPMQMEVVKAHLDHCRRCQQRCAHLRDAAVS